MAQKTNTDEFHDSESGDIFDLYNACNGVLHNGLLDINKLDEYSADEAVALNVPRLREIWVHTASGCAECERIIKALNSIRGSLSGSPGEPQPEPSAAAEPDFAEVF